MLDYSTNLKKPSRELRSNMTDTEQTLWARVRRKQLLGVQFYRQKPIGCFIVDFYAPAAKLVVEVDGSQHQEAEQARKDELRDQCLADVGLLVIRFNNAQVLYETDNVVALIAEVVQSRLGNPP